METAWPDIVGYRFEVLHTGVLKHLLEGLQGPRIAAALLGEPVVSVPKVALEPRVGAGRNRADLEFRAELTTGECVRVIVETKVDSNASIDQLKHFEHALAANESWRIVFFGLGYSAFFVPRQLVESWGDRWAWVDAGRWAEVLRSLDLPNDLTNYAEIVEREAREQRRCFEQVASAATWTKAERLDSTWGHRVAWLHETRLALNEGSDGRPTEWLDGVWTEVNGHAVQFGREFEGWTFRSDEAGRPNFYVEIVANDDQTEHPNGFRWLAFKVGGQRVGSRQPLDDGARAIRAALEHHGHVDTDAAPFRPRDSWKTATIATIDLSNATPESAADQIRTAVDDVTAVASNAVAALDPIGEPSG